MPRDRKSSAPRRAPAAATSWDPLAAWYDGWVGEGGSEHHRQVAIPAALRLLNPRPGEKIVDIGAGQGVLAPAIVAAGSRYVGIDASPRLLEIARRRHPSSGKFILGDARRLDSLPGIEPESFDAAVFLLSLQDMDPLKPVFAAVARCLKPRGRLVLVLTHPAFRIPRQSGWGWDEGRKLVFRRIDRYLTSLAVPLKSLPGRDGRATTRSFHRPLSAYINAMGENHLLVDRMEELPGIQSGKLAAQTKPEKLARAEIPLFLGIRAWKIELHEMPAIDRSHDTSYT